VKIGESQRARWVRDRQVLGYVRVSTEQQVEAGLSLEAQTEKVTAMAVVRGEPVTEWCVDAGASAKSLDRPGMLRMLDLVDAGAVDLIIVAKLDRLTRSIADLADLLTRFDRRHVDLVSVAELVDTRSASGRTMLNLIVLMSQWEREAIGERTRDVMQHKRAKGERVGTVPYGYQLAANGVRTHHRGCPTRTVPVDRCACGGRTVQLVPAPSEQQIVETMKRLREVRLTIKEIAGRLNDAGYTTRHGTPWRPAYVARQLRKVVG